MKNSFISSIVSVMLGLLALNSPFVVLSAEEPPVCNDVGELMYGNPQACQKGDVIIVNPMMAAFLCDMKLPNIAGETTVVCHYLGKKRPAREAKKK